MAKPAATGRTRGRANAMSPTPPPSPLPQQPQSDHESEDAEPHISPASSRPSPRDNSPQHPVQPSKKAKIITHLTDKQEESMIEWLTEHPEFYNKKLNNYKDTKAKQAVWEANARQMDLDCKYKLY